VQAEVHTIRYFPKVGGVFSSPYAELRVGNKSVKSKTLSAPQEIAATAIDSISFDEALEMEVPKGEEKGKLCLVLVDSGTGNDIGEIVFPVHKLATVGTVQGWYHLKEPGSSKTAGEVKGYNEATGQNDGQPAAVKCKLSIQGSLHVT